MKVLFTEKLQFTDFRIMGKNYEISFYFVVSKEKVGICGKGKSNLSLWHLIKF